MIHTDELPEILKKFKWLRPIYGFTFLIVGLFVILVVLIFEILHGLYRVLVRTKNEFLHGQEVKTFFRFVFALIINNIVEDDQ